MSDLEALLDPTDPAARRRGLAAVLRAPEAPRQLERALFGLLDLGDAPLLAELARGLAPRADDPAARRVLEALTRAPGEARVPALRALRGEAPPLPPALAALARAAEAPSPEALDDAELALIELEPEAADAAARAAVAARLTQAATRAEPALRERLERLARALA